jgi:hypothetical protein
METEKPDIQLEESSPFWLRFCLMAAACFALVWEITARFTQADAPSRGDNATLLFILFICGWIILEALFKCNVRWTIQSNEIRIDKNWIYGREQVELVKGGDITKIKIATQSDEGNDRSYIRL